MNALAHAAHLISAVIWIGGMFFAYVILRPSVANYEPARRLVLWQGVFKKFFPWVMLCILVLLLSGYAMVFLMYGGFANSPFYVHLMQLIGWAMVLLFFSMLVRPYQAFKKAVVAENWPKAGAALNQVRLTVLVNLILGIVLLITVTAGRYFL